MGYAEDKIELECYLAVQRLASLEVRSYSNSNEDKNQVAIIDEAVSKTGEDIVSLLTKNHNTNILEIYENYCNETLKTSRYKHMAEIFSQIAQEKLEIKFDEKMNTIVEGTPNALLSIMDSISDSSDDLNNSLFEKFDLRFFVSSYLVYKVREQSYNYNPEKINKKDLYKEVYEEGYDPDDPEAVRNKIRRIQDKYSELFSKASEEPDIKYETIKKRMQKVLPSKNQSDTMDNAHYINVFEQNAFMVVFFIYHTKYQHFMSNPKTRRAPDFFEVKEIKEAIEDFLMEVPISEIDNELFLKTVMQDTYHFSLINAITKLTAAFIKEIIKIMEVAKNYDSLTSLFIINKMIGAIPSISEKWIGHFSDITHELDKYTTTPGVKESVLEASVDEESIEFVEGILNDFIEKFGTIYESDDAEYKDNKDLTTEEKITNDIFKYILKLFYDTDYDQTAYQK